MDKKYTYKEINRLAQEPKKFISECSCAYRHAVDEVANVIFGNPESKIIMLAGPSSSGKTTTARVLSEMINRLGGKAYTVSLDDFYLPRNVQYPLDENGKPDFECVEALDLDLLHSSLRSIARNEKTMLPVFDFKTGMRIENSKTVELHENDVIIVEGLHALNPVITDTLDETKLFRIYISVSSRVYDDGGEVLLSKRDLRFVRRMLRDYQFRSMPVERTFEIWRSVMRGEDKYLFPFENLADVRINSFHPCEPCIFSKPAVERLADVGGEFKENADLLLKKLSLFKDTDYNILPEDSLLREFTG